MTRQRDRSWLVDLVLIVLALGLSWLGLVALGLAHDPYAWRP